MSVFKNLHAFKHVKRKKQVVKVPLPQARSGGLKDEAVVLTQGNSATRGNALFYLGDKRAVDLLIRFFSLLPLLRAYKKLVNDRGSQGVWRPSASGQGSLHNLLPLIHPLRFFLSNSAMTVPIKCNFQVKLSRSVWHFFNMHSWPMWYCIYVKSAIRHYCAESNHACVIHMVD